jgi:hypothetical protein
MYNFDTVCDPETALRPLKCTNSHTSKFQIISRLKEGKQVIMLNSVIELADHGQCFQCAAIIDTGAMGLFIDHTYAVQMQTELY